MRLAFGQGALICSGFDLVEQDVARPAELGGGAEIVQAGVENQISYLKSICCVPKEFLQQACCRKCSLAPFRAIYFS